MTEVQTNFTTIDATCSGANNPKLPQSLKVSVIVNNQDGSAEPICPFYKLGQNGKGSSESPRVRAWSTDPRDLPQPCRYARRPQNKS